MAQEKIFENKIKAFLKNHNAWFIKYWAGAQFTKSGIPDILASVNGYFVAVEVKAANGKPSELQEYQVGKINHSGGFAVILYPKDFDMFKRLVDYLYHKDIKNARKLVHIINNKERRQR